MRTLTQTILVGLLALMLTTSCSNEPSLQKFIVENQESKGWITADISKDLLGIDESKLDAESRAAFNTIDKANIIVLRLTDSNLAEYEAKSNELSQILKNEKYHSLMSMENEDMQMMIKYEGEKDEMDELIIFGKSDGYGMGVIRILGDDMKSSDMTKFLKAMESSDMDESGLTDIFKQFGVE